MPIFRWASHPPRRRKFLPPETPSPARVRHVSSLPVVCSPMSQRSSRLTPGLAARQARPPPPPPPHRCPENVPNRSLPAVSPLSTPPSPQPLPPGFGRTVFLYLRGLERQRWPSNEGGLRTGTHPKQAAAVDFAEEELHDLYSINLVLQPRRARSRAADARKGCPPGPPFRRARRAGGRRGE